MSARTALVSALALLAGCGGGGADQAPPGDAGPCVHQSIDPVLAITAATSTGGTPIPALRLTAITVDGRPLPLGLLDASARNVVVSDGGIDCTVACGFGTQEGTYRFIASAPGHQPTAVQVDARYAVFQGGCPSSSSGSTPVVVTLPPA